MNSRIGRCKENKGHLVLVLAAYCHAMPLTGLFTYENYVTYKIIISTTSCVTCLSRYDRYIISNLYLYGLSLVECGKCFRKYN